ncbi:mitochondrial 37S ribosomal protein uS7m KNAG_0D01270 [Huiozyma naganishii CBS 8797]|uniref:Small ribosomal subunit protein uS7m n=1 Tax=Huiozyma naganishii (strain ATCC MYA-139 / BCRC 22969 / CBS 8797 / KCTC 17520 / NBRC 10181 / NCYC 3082 / Yp74L-3) TaxID=1071383 RepID=J7S5J6_HUIN7|nr:hypothetical protein KNAG_0D01270 [Kazachstania naganishii CBS 8797]CCK69879.1 hypothetical protein KNAG_0D01270 [Kazachstania naganishii CBS 8797]
MRRTVQLLDPLKRVHVSCRSGLLYSTVPIARTSPQRHTLQRFQSTTTAAPEKEELSTLTDEEVDSWLHSINDLRAQFRRDGFTPDDFAGTTGATESLTLAKEAQKLINPEFKPTQEQIDEFEQLRGKPIPKRKDPILEHVTNMIMRHGKKQLAERTLSRALYIVFCKTRKDPVELLKKSLDDLAPLMIVKTFNTGVAKAAVIPVPLNQRQRHRIAWKWIMEGANGRVSSDFAVRLGEELVSVANGSSSGFDKRDQLHKTAIAHRSYIKLK